jgi:hypothetical protein
MNDRTRTLRKVLIGIIAWILLPSSIQAASALFTWDPPETYEDGTPLGELSGYRLYHGLTSGIYTNHIDVGNSNTVRYSDLLSGCSNYFAVTAIDGLGTESDFSSELAIYVFPSIIISTNELLVIEGTSSTFQVRLDAYPIGIVTSRVSRVNGGNCYLGVIDGATLVFSPSNWNSNQTVTIAALYDPVKTNRTAIFKFAGDGLLSGSIVISSVGEAQNPTESEDQRDIDGNGIPDAWEIYYFGGINVRSSYDDFEPDGVSNFHEYIAGTDPTDAESRPLLGIRTTDDKVEVYFLTIEAYGAGYLGKSRFYTLESRPDLVLGAWEEIPTATNIIARNQTFTYLESSSDSNMCFYRIVIRLY